jgi:hypothetical protein
MILPLVLFALEFSLALQCGRMGRGIARASGGAS